MPDIASKKASVMVRSSSEYAKGREPKIAITSHARLVKRNASRSENPAQPERVVSIMATLTNRVVPDAAVKTS